VHRGIKIPKKGIRLRFFRSFFLNLEVSRGEPTALLFFSCLAKGCSLDREQPFFYSAAAERGPAAGAMSDKTIIGREI
jgi:hypothetical protein